MRKFGSFVNPFFEKVPPGEPVKDIDRKQFEETVSKYEEELYNI